MNDDHENEDIDDTKDKALDAARRAVQFLESGQATGIFILLTNSDRAVMWDTFISPSPHPIGDASKVLSEMGSRLRQVWYELITENGDRGFLVACKDDSTDSTDSTQE